MEKEELFKGTTRHLHSRDLSSYSFLLSIMSPPRIIYSLEKLRKKKKKKMFAENLPFQ